MLKLSSYIGHRILKIFQLLEFVLEIKYILARFDDCYPIVIVYIIK